MANENSKVKKATPKKVKKEEKLLENEDVLKEEEIVEENEKAENSDGNDKVKVIIEKAKKQGKITYGEIASELENTNPEEIEKVFDAFEELNVNLKDDLEDEEPDIEDLEKISYTRN